MRLAVPEQFLDRPDVRAGLQQVRGERMTLGMANGWQPPAAPTKSKGKKRARSVRSESDAANPKIPKNSERAL
jgi:hypothetical protein